LPISFATMATVDSTAPPADRPPRLSANPFLRVANDLRAEWRGRGAYPPGPSDFSFSISSRFIEPSRLAPGRLGGRPRSR